MTSVRQKVNNVSSVQSSYIASHALVDLTTRGEQIKACWRTFSSWRWSRR